MAHSVRKSKKVKKHSHVHAHPTNRSYNHKHTHLAIGQRCLHRTSGKYLPLGANTKMYEQRHLRKGDRFGPTLGDLFKDNGHPAYVEVYRPYLYMGYKNNTGGRNKLETTTGAPTTTTVAPAVSTTGVYNTTTAPVNQTTFAPVASRLRSMDVDFGEGKTGQHDGL